MVWASEQDASWAPPIWKFSRHIQLGGDLGTNPELSGKIPYLIWLGMPRDPQEGAVKENIFFLLSTAQSLMKIQTDELINKRCTRPNIFAGISHDIIIKYVFYYHDVNISFVRSRYCACHNIVTPLV